MHCYKNRKKNPKLQYYLSGWVYLIVMGQESLPAPAYTEGAEISTCPTGLTPSFLALTSGDWNKMFMFYHKGSIKATKRMLHRTVWFWEFALPPVPWCHCRLLLGRLPAALGTSMTAPFCISRTAPGAPSSSKDTSRSAHEEDNVQSHDQRTYILWGSNHRKRMPAHWFTEQVDADRNWNLQWFVSTCCLWTAVAEERWIAADLTISDGELVTFDGCSWVKNLKS